MREREREARIRQRHRMQEEGQSRLDAAAAAAKAAPLPLTAPLDVSAPRMASESEDTSSGGTAAARRRRSSLEAMGEALREIQAAAAAANEAAAESAAAASGLGVLTGAASSAHASTSPVVASPRLAGPYGAPVPASHLQVLECVDLATPRQVQVQGHHQRQDSSASVASSINSTATAAASVASQLSATRPRSAISAKLSGSGVFVPPAPYVAVVVNNSTASTPPTFREPSASASLALAFVPQPQQPQATAAPPIAPSAATVVVGVAHDEQAASAESRRQQQQQQPSLSGSMSTDSLRHIPVQKQQQRPHARTLSTSSSNGSLARASVFVQQDAERSPAQAQWSLVPALPLHSPHDTRSMHVSSIASGSGGGGGGGEPRNLPLSVFKEEEGAPSVADGSGDSGGHSESGRHESHPRGSRASVLGLSKPRLKQRLQRSMAHQLLLAEAAQGLPPTPHALALATGAGVMSATLPANRSVPLSLQRHQQQLLPLPNVFTARLMPIAGSTANDGSSAGAVANDAALAVAAPSSDSAPSAAAITAVHASPPPPRGQAPVQSDQQQQQGQVAAAAGLVPEGLVRKAPPAQYFARTATGVCAKCPSARGVHVCMSASCDGYSAHLSVHLSDVSVSRPFSVIV